MKELPVFRLIRVGLMTLTVYGCVDYFSFKVPDPFQVLVVDGLITNEPGPYKVQLLYASGVHNYLGYATPALGASVVVFDDAGNSEKLHEVGEGIYETNPSGIQGQVGRQYHVEIQLTNGKKYQSQPELMGQVGSLDSVYFEFSHQEEVLSTGVILPVNGFNVYVNASGSPDHQNLLRWEWQGTYKIFTHPEWAKYIPPDIPPGPCYIPLPCSGYRATACLSVEKIPGEVCTCCTCWVTQYQVSTPVSDDQFFANGKFTRVNIAFIPSNRLSIPSEFFNNLGFAEVTSIPFYDKYFVDVRQLSLTPLAHQFWKLINIQRSTASNLFQPQSSVIRGNVYSLSNDQEEVLGLFTASAVTKKSIYIHRSDIPFEYAGADDVFPDDCRNYDSTATTTQPSFWIND